MRSQEAHAARAAAKAKLLPCPSQVFRMVSATRQEEAYLGDLRTYGFSWPEPTQPWVSKIPKGWKRVDWDASGSRMVDNFTAMLPISFEEILPAESPSPSGYDSRELGSVWYSRGGITITFTYTLHERLGSDTLWSCQAVIKRERHCES